MADKQFEPDDLSVYRLTGVLAILTFAILLVLAGVAWLQTGYQQQLAARQPPMSALQREALATPAPRLQADPKAEGDHHLARDTARLHSYGWVDRHAGIVRIPVQQARQQLLRNGWPTASPEAAHAP